MSKESIPKKGPPKKGPPKKGPLEGLREAVESGKVRLPTAEEVRAKVEQWGKDEEDKRLMRGKYAPRPGVCRVCDGKVVAKVTTKYLGDPMHMIIGPGSRNQMVTRNEGWHCSSCGIRYEFCPKPKS